MMHKTLMATIETFYLSKCQADMFRMNVPSKEYSLNHTFKSDRSEYNNTIIPYPAYAGFRK